MDTSDLIAIIAAIVAAGGLYVAYLQHTRVRAQDQVETLRYFLTAYRDLAREGGDPAEHVCRCLKDQKSNESWLFDYWSMLSTEYYFFHKGQLPAEVFGIWMGDVARQYRDHAALWPAHCEFLKQYEPSPSRTWLFFHQLSGLAFDGTEDDLRHRVNQFVAGWSVPELFPASWISRDAPIAAQVICPEETDDEVAASEAIPGTSIEPSSDGIPTRRLDGAG